MPLTATPMISEAPNVAARPFSVFAHHRAAVPATMAMITERMNRSGL
jgi:hypothetical protein